jgi:pullulanase/glycogen debranching enzyme
MNQNNNYMNDYLYKVEESFVSVQYQFDDMKKFLNMDMFDLDKYIDNFNYNIEDINYELFEFELRLRALRDKLNESEIL